MSDARSVEELAKIYAEQSAGGFFSTAMSLPVKDEPAGERKYVNKGCDWPCCNEQGECKPICFVCLAAGIAVLFACCCYVSNGFGDRWPFWPY